MTSLELLNRISRLEHLIDEQAKRIGALEARLAADDAPGTRPCNRERTTRSAQLRAAIVEIIAAHDGAAKMTAKHVRVALDRRRWTPMPSLRSVQWHMTRAARNAQCDQLRPELLNQQDKSNTFGS